MTTLKLFPSNSLRSFAASSIAVVGVWAIAAPGHAITIDKVVTVQPIQVCSDAGDDCANVNQTLFAAETNKIWAQAGITFNFLNFTQFNSTFFQTNVDDDNADDSLTNLFDSGSANPDDTVISMWFIKQFDSLDTFGVAFLNSNRLAIADNVFSFNFGNGRLDTIAHEIGHTFGLDHNTFGTDDDITNNLMTSGGTRLVPDTIGDITPDGANLDQLNQLQIDQARNSPTAKAVPTPSLVFGLAGMGLASLRKNRKEKKERALSELA
ncbi:MAG: hypothetical protein KME14_08060 [Tildeniella torsiva UHER 1998/13D]|jgi:hypothetical protein|nr:hypothetical protein [Tildeniella torsiva UHER 1998/13D]